MLLARLSNLCKTGVVDLMPRREMALDPAESGITRWPPLCTWTTPTPLAAVRNLPLFDYPVVVTPLFATRAHYCSKYDVRYDMIEIRDTG